MEEQNNQSQTPTPATPQTTPPTPPIEHKSGGFASKLSWLIIAVLLVLVGIFGGYFVLNQTQQNQTPSPTPTISGQPQTQTSPTQAPTKSAKETKTFTSAKFPDLSFKGYTLTYPADWELSEERKDLPTPISTVTLTKDGYTLKIYQAATGGAGCIYEGEVPEGPFSDYRNNEYKDIESFAILRQTESPNNGKMSYAYCQKSETEDSFGQPTSVGHMSVATGVEEPDPQIVVEIEEIVKSIKEL